MSKNKKIRLEDLVAKTIKVPLTKTVKIDGEVHEDFEVGWVEVRGCTDPEYLQPSAKLYLRSETRKAEIMRSVPEGGELTEEQKDEIIELNKTLGVESMAHAIVDWDEDFFGKAYSHKSGVEFLSNTKYLDWFNKISVQVGSIDDFLPDL